MTRPSIFIGTPVHGSQVHQDWLAGVLTAKDAFAGRIVIELEKGSFLPRQRDQLTRRFFDSGASHMLCVDSDIGWRASHVEALLATGKDFISGIYAIKDGRGDVPFSFTGERQGELLGCEWAPGGFLLVARPVVERMMGAYQGLQYKAGTGTRLTALWSMMFDPDTPYSSEDVSFCKRWRRLGGEIWAHSGVVLKHYGETVYLPRDGWHSQTTSSQ